MSVTITITVSPTGAAEVRTGEEATGEAPPPSLLGGLGTATGEAGLEAAGPAPLELAELGLGAGAETTEGAGGPPPEDVAGVEADTTAEAPEPTPVEELK